MNKEQDSWTAIIIFKYEYEHEQCYRIPWKEYTDKLSLLNVMKGFHYLDRMADCTLEELKYYYDHYPEIRLALNCNHKKFDEQVHYYMWNELDQHYQILDIILDCWRTKGYLVSDSETIIKELDLLSSDKRLISIKTVS